jgi:hypothetical protein
MLSNQIKFQVIPDDVKSGMWQNIGFGGNEHYFGM